MIVDTPGHIWFTDDTGELVLANGIEGRFRREQIAPGWERWSVFPVVASNGDKEIRVRLTELPDALWLEFRNGRDETVARFRWYTVLTDRGGDYVPLRTL